MTYRVKKVDSNQAALVKQIRQIPGVNVIHTHTIGNGMVDLVMGYKGVNYLLEVKDPAKVPSARKLTPDEEKFHKEWTGQICVVETFEDVLKIINTVKP